MGRCEGFSDSLQLHRTTRRPNWNRLSAKWETGSQEGDPRIAGNAGRHAARTRTNREGLTGVFCLVDQRTTRRLDWNRSQPSGKVVLESGAGHARETTSTESEQIE